jgi:hypothetical protein
LDKATISLLDPRAKKVKGTRGGLLSLYAEHINPYSFFDTKAIVMIMVVKVVPLALYLVDVEHIVISLTSTF